MVKCTFPQWLYGQIGHGTVDNDIKSKNRWKLNAFSSFDALISGKGRYAIETAKKICAIYEHGAQAESYFWIM